MQEQYKLTDEQKAAIKDFAKRLAAGEPEAVSHANSVGITIVERNKPPFTLKKYLKENWKQLLVLLAASVIIQVAIQELYKRL